MAELLRATFAVELTEQAEALNAELLGLKDAPADPARVRAIFRIAHTLKGAAAAAGMQAIATACHALEDRLSVARDGTRPLEADDMTMLFEAADTLEQCGAALRDAQPTPDARLAALEARARSSASDRRTLGNRRRRRSATNSPGETAAAQISPSAGMPPASTGEIATVSGQFPATGAEGTVRVAAEKLDALLAASGALLATRGSLDDRRSEVEALVDELRRWTRRWRRSARGVRAELARRGASGAPTRALHELDESMRESERALSRLSDNLARDTRAMTTALGEATHRVQQLRMRPFKDACARLPRAVHDAAAATGREARLVVEDGGVQLDRSIVDGLADALLPLVRNAVDHGIEPPDVRERAGKPRAGTLRICATLSGDRVLVTLSDDGAGVDEAAVRAAMERKGEPIADTREAVAEALLGKTVSTRTQVSETSGRGVGVDIVVSAMRRIRGSVRVAWTAGRGTSFTLECPPSLATLGVVVIALGDHLFAVPSGHVMRVARVGDADIRTVSGKPALPATHGAGEVIPLVSLAAVLGPPVVARPRSGLRQVLILGSPGRQLGVTVDAVIGADDVVLHPVEHPGEELPFVAGITMLGNGRLATVLNGAAIVDSGRKPGAPHLLETLENGAAMGDRKCILVVDDSITTRTLESSLLEAAGFDVIGAVDGSDGWRLLQERAVDLVVSDVEMPKMDGLDLCRAIRSSPRVARLPIILVTALESSEYRRRGLEAGADAYLAKSTFEQDALLRVVRQLLGGRASGR
jgi:two-component system chemotaxis sensor kinase CheA